MSVQWIAGCVRMKSAAAGEQRAARDVCALVAFQAIPTQGARGGREPGDSSLAFITRGDPSKLLGGREPSVVSKWLGPTPISTSKLKPVRLPGRATKHVASANRNRGRGLQPPLPLRSSVSTSLLTAFSVSNTPSPVRAWASKSGTPVGLSCARSSATSTALGRSRLLY